MGRNRSHVRCSIQVKRLPILSLAKIQCNTHSANVGYNLTATNSRAANTASMTAKSIV